MGDVSPINRSRFGTYKKGQVDPFTLDDDDEGKPSFKSYDPDHIYVRSTDGHGHSENVQTKFPPEVVGAMHNVVNSGCIPEYGNSIQSLVRNAIIHQLVKDSKRINSGELERVLSRQVALARAEAMKQETEENEQLIRGHKELLEEAAARNDWEMLSRVIQEGELITQTLGGVYQEKLKQELAIYRTKLKNI